MQSFNVRVKKNRKSLLAGVRDRDGEIVRVDRVPSVGPVGGIEFQAPILFPQCHEMCIGR